MRKWVSVDFILHESVKLVVLHRTERWAQTITGGEQGSTTHTACSFKWLQEWKAMTLGSLSPASRFR